MKMKKRIIALLLAVLLAVGLIGCKDVLKGIVHKATGTSDEVQEEDTTRWADATADPLIIQGIADCQVCRGHGRRLPVRRVQRHLEPQHRLFHCAHRQPEYHGLRHR